MKIFNDATSPFGRKILVGALERSIAIEEQFVDIYASGPVDLLNPLRQIPTVTTDANEALYDSDVIFQFLDTLHGGSPLFPRGDWQVLTRTSLANGLIEAVLQRVMELRRAPSEQSAAVIERLESRIWRVLRRLEENVDLLIGEPLHGDQITAACALEYVDFRYRQDWRSRHPALAKWLEPVSQRPSMMRTSPTRTGPLLPASRRQAG